jgi:nucleolar protein 56
LKKETVEEKRARLMAAAKASISSAYASDEHSIIQAINSYLAIEKVGNLIYERLEEWYSMYFPELRLNNQATFAKFVIQFGKNKKAATMEELNAVVGDKASEVFRQIRSSIGREPSEEEYGTIRTLAESELSLIDVQSRIDAYLEKSTKKFMPNICYLIDYKIAAEMLSRAGSLNRFATMPAGTIQLLGAEKALFKHLKYGSKSPKHGTLFKLQEMALSNKHMRGKIARVYATKLCTASKADAFTKRFIADKLKQDIDRSLKEIKKKAQP